MRTPYDFRVVPRFNDSEEELRDIARFIKSVSPDIPWHVTAFHRDYKMCDRNGTPSRQIMRGAAISYEEGLHFVYAGNRPGEVGNFENTYCPGCGALLIERFGFSIVQNNLRNNCCPKCARPIPGVWRLEDLPAARACRHRDVTTPDIAAIVAEAQRKFAPAPPSATPGISRTDKAVA
ncbi:MAG: hypothetical protein FJ388_08775 [Verrucomicrobia bacterium]|nr:hypothetical protein [Verrucomicrobiota bacterium]